MNYQTLFDLGEYGYRDGPYWFVGAALALLAFGLYLWQRRRARRNILPAFFGIVSLVISVGAGGVPLWDHHRLLAEYNAGRARVVEGTVSSHRVEQVATRRASGSGYDRSTWESFEVAGVAFAFDRSPSAVGFRNQFERPVELHDGQRLRVHFVEDVPGDRTQRRIVRLERAP